VCRGAGRRQGSTNCVNACANCGRHRASSARQVQADTKYTKVVTTSQEALIRKSLQELQAELDPSIFWPIHRSTVVNANAIAAVSRDFRGRLSVTLKQREERLSVSESHQHLFKQM
jgi:DNA-binding LytR/AlgR family response regulator